jgi:GINS complex subunit 1
MYGDVAIKLVKELQRNTDATHVPPYREESVRQVIRETNCLYADVKQLLQAKESLVSQSGHTLSEADLIALEAVKTSSMIRHLSMRRNKRCLLAYHHTRMERIKNMAWQQGALSQETRRKLSASENQFYTDYYQLIRDYGSGVSQLLDLSVAERDLTTTQGGRWVFAEIRVVKDAGTIETENGVLNLQVGTQHFVRRADVQQLIKEGYVVELGRQ